MKVLRTSAFVLVALVILLTACGPAATEAPTMAPTEVPTMAPTEAPTMAPTEAPVTGVVCTDPIKVGFITDLTGYLAIYGAHMVPSFMLGMEYATGAAGSAGSMFDTAEAQQNDFMLDDCAIQVFLRDDASTPDTTATVARELIEVQGVDVLVGTVSSAAVATLQGIAAENMIPLIVAPGAANDITGKDFNEYTFRTSRNNYQDAINECTYLVKQYSTFVQIAPDYAFGQGSAASFRDACGLGGATFMVDDIFAPADTTDFTLTWSRSSILEQKLTS